MKNYVKSWYTSVMRKKVLLIGNSAKEYALAKKLSESCEVFVAPGNDGIKEFAECLDIRETAAEEILEFALENGIDITVPVSEVSLKTNIVELFARNNMQIFAPSQKAQELIFDKFSAKRIMYKLGIPTPKFGIFEKQNIASDYIKNLKNTYVIKNNSPSSSVILTSPQASKIMLDSMFLEKFSRVLVEDYIYGTPFGFYTITDGYKALPIGSSMLYKHSLEGDGGQLTSGMGACSPNYKLSFENEEYLMNSVIYPTLYYLEQNNANYTGVLGVNGILCEDGTLKILGYQSFMQEADCAGILNMLEEDIYNLFESCIVGSFSDEIEFIRQKNLASTSVVLCCRDTGESENTIQNLENIDEDILISFTKNVHKNKYLEYEAKQGSAMVLTAFAGTPAQSAKKVYEEIPQISFKGMKYRRDICFMHNN